MSQVVLILDDDEHVRLSLSSQLEDEGYAVCEAGSSQAGLDILKDRKVDLAIVDLRLPDVDGNDFIYAARDIQPDLKYIVYTGSPEYHIPSELTSLPTISKSVFLKPLRDCDIMIEEIKRMLG